jgi:hypothetical protein
MHYNHDDHLCRQCDEEPVVYNGLCELCLSGDERDPYSGKFSLRHATRHGKRRRNKEDDE